MKKNIISLFLLAVSLTVFNAQANAMSRIELIEIDQPVQINYIDNMLHITGANGQVVEVYAVTGLRVMTLKIDSPDKRIELNLRKGCYIVKVGKTARKITVK